MVVEVLIQQLETGGCPFAKNELVGNISTESLINYIQTKKINIKLIF